MIYTGKDQFQGGIAILTMLSFELPYFIFLKGVVDPVNVFLAIVYLFILKKELKFLRLLYKENEEGKKFINLLIATILVSLFMSFFPKNTFYGQAVLTYSLFAWYLYFTLVHGGRIYDKNVELAESTGDYNLRHDKNNP